MINKLLCMESMARAFFLRKNKQTGRMLKKKKRQSKFLDGGEKKKGKTKPHNTQTVCISQIQGLTGGQFSRMCRMCTFTQRPCTLRTQRSPQTAPNIPFAPGLYWLSLKKYGNIHVVQNFRIYNHSQGSTEWSSITKQEGHTIEESVLIRNEEGSWAHCCQKYKFNEPESAQEKRKKKKKGYNRNWRS